ncbi:transporter [Klebsiella pneumoniae]|nr:transporter [Klebsiella pneumoniae]
MSMSSIPSSSPGGKRYGWVEKIGNKVPHPFLLFIYLIAVLIAATAILSALNVGVQNPTDGSRVVVKNLLSVEGLHWFLPNVIKTSAVSRRWGRSSPWFWAPALPSGWACYRR